ncbi:TetR family transcriptional regulator [Streptomyces daqingensis]|jgi:AcrR family transcriptional regulator|uniref:TetR family transcriptional regulator n=1 Tax=Streptomyces daqingensis TaxID=1472640 RepID=A0ABQ2MV70_9ACTN|nr:TetR/AcrR family transcriptional regulator [Streptomyces daqingensis]GGO58556.1 TetR family transcriptional regulator [Streptomyces daqingensis]
MSSAAPGSSSASGGRRFRTPDASRRSERSRRAILDASMELVGEVGYNRLTIEAVAARAGVGKQTIYRWWPSKAAVLLEAFTTVVTDDEYEAGIPDTGDLEADLKQVLRATVDEFTDAAFEAPYRALAVAGAADAELSEQFLERLMAPGMEVYSRRLRSAQEAGQIAEDVDIGLAVEMLLGPFQQRWLQRTGNLTHEFTDALVDLALRGLAPR